MDSCKKCGNPLIGRWNKKFCSRSCSVSANNLGKRKYGKSPNDCLVCKKKTRSCHNVFCSHICEQEYKWKKRKEFIISNGKFNCRDVIIKKYLLEKNGNICSICFNTKWNGAKIPLILDHIDGHSENKNKDNFRLVCGNCDMLLPTYKSKNRGNGRYSRRIRYAKGQSF